MGAKRRTILSGLTRHERKTFVGSALIRVGADRSHGQRSVWVLAGITRKHRVVGFGGKLRVKRHGLWVRAIGIQHQVAFLIEGAIGVGAAQWRTQFGAGGGQIAMSGQTNRAVTVTRCPKRFATGKCAIGTADTRDCRSDVSGGKASISGRSTTGFVAAERQTVSGITLF